MFQTVRAILGREWQEVSLNEFAGIQSPTGENEFEFWRERDRPEELFRADFETDYENQQIVNSEGDISHSVDKVGDKLLKTKIPKAFSADLDMCSQDTDDSVDAETSKNVLYSRIKEDRDYAEGFAANNPFLQDIKAQDITDVELSHDKFTAQLDDKIEQEQYTVTDDLGKPDGIPAGGLTDIICDTQSSGLVTTQQPPSDSGEDQIRDTTMTAVLPDGPSDSVTPEEHSGTVALGRLMPLTATVANPVFISYCNHKQLYHVPLYQSCCNDVFFVDNDAFGSFYSNNFYKIKIINNILFINVEIFIYKRLICRLKCKITLTTLTLVHVVKLFSSFKPMRTATNFN